FTKQQRIVLRNCGIIDPTNMEEYAARGGIRAAFIDDLESRLAPTSEPDALFQSHDISFKGGLAYQLTPELSAGFGMGWLIEKIGSWRGSSFNLDFGGLYRVNKALHLGASVTNLGGDFRLRLGGESSDEISLPTTYRFGGSYRYRRVLGAMDFVYLDEEMHYHLGGEVEVHEVLALRAGFMTGYDTKDITAGATFTHRNFAFDYGFVPYSDELGSAHMFNMTVSL
ncbi:MAG: hypothetical protein KKA42_15525, partial [candidate division Zixibacteria bacterium]|nr:hypothetical protein [candidate division Zixibacteria bacterium]